VLAYFLELYIIHKEQIIEQHTEVTDNPFITGDSTILVFNTAASRNEMRMYYSSMPYISKKEFVTLISKGDKVVLGVHKYEAIFDEKSNTFSAEPNHRINVYSLKKDERTLASLDDHNRLEYILLQIGLALGFVIWAFVLLSYFKVIRVKEDKYFTIVILLVLIAVFFLSMTTMFGGYCRLD
jgi:Na+(H+)/acetate symporter ActP